MQKIDVDEIKPSMVLASTVKDNHGNVIFLKGVSLTERHISILRNRDIKRVVVEGCPLEKDKTITEDLLKEIDERFSTAESSPAALKIRDIIKELIV